MVIRKKYLIVNGVMHRTSTLHLSTLKRLNCAQVVKEKMATHLLIMKNISDEFDK